MAEEGGNENVDDVIREAPDNVPDLGRVNLETEDLDKKSNKDLP